MSPATSHAGEANNAAKLSEAQAREIKRLRAAGVYLKVIAHEFAVSPSAVHLIATGKRWAHLSGEAA